MTNELDIIDSLQALRYKGNCLQNDGLTDALEGGLNSRNFLELVQWLAQELHVLRKTDEHISAELDNASEFAIELSSLLKELGCPYGQLVTGPLSERYNTRESLLCLLDYLLTELMATKMTMKVTPTDNSYVISKFTTNTAKSLEQLSKDLQVGKPPANVTAKALFDKLNFKVEEVMRQLKPGLLSEPLLNLAKPLSDEQWTKLDELHEELDYEYNMRRQVLLTRLEVTIQSFQWSEKMKDRENEIAERFQKKMQEMEQYKCGGNDTNIVALLAARKDLAIIEKTSSANVRKNTAAKIQKHVIGSVPDRGGRAHEHAPPPPEMPSWQQQRASGPGGSRGGGGGGGNFRGGRGGGGGGGGGHRQNNYQQGPQPARFEQRQQFDQGRDNSWMAGSGRVQGSGWTQKGNDYNDRQDNHNDYGHQNGGGRGGRGGGGGGNYRGRSNYNRGGGGGYGGGGGNRR